jgi:transcription termination/antitermination protein NusG
MNIINSLEEAPEPPLRSESTAAWYALRVRANFEATVLRQVEGLGWECFLPQYAVKRPTGECQRPLFPGYVFSRFNLADHGSIVRVRGLVHIVANAGRPESIPEQEIEIVRQVLRSGLMASPYPKLAKGQRVVIEAGPLVGLEGVILRIKNRYHVVVSITMLQRSIVAEIDAQWLRPIKPAGRAGWLEIDEAVALPA